MKKVYAHGRRRALEEGGVESADTVLPDRAARENLGDELRRRISGGEDAIARPGEGHRGSGRPFFVIDGRCFFDAVGDKVEDGKRTGLLLLPR